MDFYDFDCPIRYPNKCNLLPEEYEPLVHKDKYVVFLIYQFKGSIHARKVIGKYFNPEKYHLLDAQQEPAVGVKMCKICRLALAADFGVALLSPLNYNVFLEVGMMLGMQKPVLFILNPNKLPSEKMPFDLSHEIVIPYKTVEELRQGLHREEPMFLRKVGKTAEYRDIRKALVGCVQEINTNEQLNKRLDKEPPLGIRYRIYRLGQLLEIPNVPEHIYQLALSVYSVLELVNNSLVAAPILRPIVGKPIIEKEWNAVQEDVSKILEEFKSEILRWLDETSRLKPT